MHHFGSKFRYLFRAAALFLISLACAGGLLAAAAPYLVERPQVRAVLLRRLEAWSGSPVVIDGPIRLGSLIALTVEARDVRLPSTAKLSPLMRLEARSVKAIVSFRALLEGRFDFEKLIVTDAKVVLKHDLADGFKAGNVSVSSLAIPLDFASGMSFTELVFRRTTFFVPDGSRRPFRAVFASQLRVARSAAGVRWLEAQTRIAGERWQFSARAGAENEGVTSLASWVKGPNTDASFRGELDRTSQSLIGNLSLSHNLSAELASAIPAAVLSIETGPNLTLSGAMTVQENKIALDQTKIRVGDHAATGSLTLTLGKSRPSLEGTLAFDTLKASPAMSAQLDGKKPGFNLIGFYPEDKSVQFPNADIDIRISADRLQLGNLASGAFAAAFTANAKHITADIAELGLFGGTVRGRVDYEPSSTGEALVTFKGSGLHVDSAMVSNSLSLPSVLRGAVDFSLGLTANARPGFIGLGSGRFQLDLPGGGSIGEDISTHIKTALDAQNPAAAMVLENGAIPLTALSIAGAIDREKISADITGQIDNLDLAGSAIIRVPSGLVSGSLATHEAVNADASPSEPKELPASILISGTAANPSFSPPHQHSFSN